MGVKIDLDPATNLANTKNRYGITIDLNAPETTRDYDYRPYDSMNFARMYQDDITSYKKYGVVPSRYFDWDETRAQNQSTADKWGNGLAKAGVTTIGAVAENTLGILFGMGELAKGGYYYDNFIGKSVDKMNEAMRESFPNFRTQAEENMSIGQKLLTANFWADTVANGFGYSLGSLATIYLTGGVGLIGRGAKAMQMYNTAKALSTGTKIAGALDKGSRFTRQGFINSVNMAEMGLYMSLAESSVEARENQKNTYDSLLAAEMEEKGVSSPFDLGEETLAGIEDASYASGNGTFFYQLPVLVGSNLIMFGKQVAGFNPASKAFKNKDLKFDNTLKTVVNTLGDRKGVYGKFRNTISRLTPTAKGAATEAFQEGWQFASNILSTDYHTDKYYDAGTANLIESLYEGVKETFGSQEGLESMLVGAIVGGGMSGGSSVINKPFKRRKAAADYAKKILDGGFMDNSNEAVGRFNAQGKALKDMEKALQANDIKAFKDAQFKLIQYNALAAIKTGTYNVFREKLKDSKSLSDAEFAKAFGFDTELTLEEQTNGQSKTDIIKNIEEKLDKFEKVYNNVNKMFPSMPKSQGLTRLRMSEAERKAEDAIYNKRENLRDELALRASGIENRHERLESIQKQMKDVIDRGAKLNGVKVDSDIDQILNPGEDLLKVEDGKYDAQTELNIMAKGLQEIKQQMLNKGVTAEVIEFDKLARDYIDLFMDNSVSIEAYNKLASSKYFQDLFENTVKANQAEAEQAAKDQKANEDIENATTSEEARKAAPEDASPEAEVNARKKARELEEEEKAAELKFLDLNSKDSLKEQLKKLKSLVPGPNSTTNLSPVELQGLRNAIKVLEDKINNKSNKNPVKEPDAENLAITDDNILRADNNKKIEEAKPGTRDIEPAATQTNDKVETDPVATSTGELDVVSSTNTDEVVNVGTPNNPIYKIPVDNQGTPIEKDSDTLDGKPILLQPELLLKEDILEEEIEFEIIENDWYKSDRLDKAEESWTEIPIYYKIGNAYIGKLQRSNTEDRKAIVDKLLKGDKVTTQISKIVATNFNNSIDSETNEFYFHNPQEIFGKNDDILIAISEPEIAGDPKTGQWDLDTVHPDKNKNDELDNIKTDITRQVTDKFNNQIGIVIKKENNPAGKARISIAMTSNLNSLANEMVIKYLAEKNYEAARMIVANSKNRKSANTNNSYLEFGAFESGQKYIVYKSPKLGKLIRINEDEFVKAINNNEAIFQIVTEKNDKFTGTKNNTTKSKINIVEDLSKFLSTKKYHVDKGLMNSKVYTKENPYISPVTGIPHDTYQDYLFSSEELGNAPRIQDAGYNSILSTDIVKKRESMFNSPRVTFKKGNILGETAGEIVKNTKIAETKGTMTQTTPYGTKAGETVVVETSPEAPGEQMQLFREAPVVPKTELSSLVSAWLQTPEGSLKNQTVEQSAGKFAIEYAKRNKLTEGLTEQQVTEQAGSLLFGTVAQGLTVMQTVQQEIENQSKQIEAPVAKKKKFKTGKKSGDIVNNLSKKCKK